MKTRSAFFLQSAFYSILALLLITTPTQSQTFNGVSMTNQLFNIEPGYENSFPLETGLAARFIMNGEIHYVNSNPVLKFQLFKSLYITNNVRYLVMESGPAFAYLYNQYLTSGDESLLSWNGYINYEITFWRYLREFNNKLPAGDKIQVLAFDFDQPHAYETAVRMIFTGITSMDAAVSSKLEQLKAIVNSPYNKENITAGNKIISKLLSSTNKEFLKNLGRDTLTLQMLVANKVPLTSRTKRDQQTYQNIRAFIHNFSAGNYFAEYGISHVNRTRHNLCYLLNEREDSPLIGQVQNILPEYINCKTGYKRLDLNYGILTLEHVKFSGGDQIGDISLIKTSKTEHKLQRLSTACDYVLVIKNQ